MRTLSYRGTVPASTFTEEPALTMKVQEHRSITICALTESTNVKIIIRYVFVDNDGTEEEADIQTVNLTADTLSVVNFNFKLGYIKIAYDDVTSTPDGGAIRIDATTAK